MSHVLRAAKERPLYQFIITMLQFYQKKGENYTIVMNLIIRYSLMYQPSLAKVPLELDFSPVDNSQINIVWIHPS